MHLYLDITDKMHIMLLCGGGCANSESIWYNFIKIDILATKKYDKTESWL